MFEELVRQIGSSRRDERERGAEQVNDVCTAFEPAQLLELVSRLVVARLVEGDESVQECQFNALASLKAEHDLDRGLFLPLRSLWQRLPTAQVEYLEFILQ